MSDLRLVLGNKNYSSWSIRAWLALKQSGLPFEEIPVWFGHPGAAEEIRRYSPAGKVPILLRGSDRVWVSLAICEAVAELAPHARLWPDDPRVRAHARSASAEMLAGFDQLRENLPMNTRARFPGRTIAPGVAAEIERITDLWRECRHEFGGGGDLLYGRFSIADAMYAPVVSRFITYGIPVDATCRAYMDAVADLPSVRNWFAQAEAETDRVEQYERLPDDERD